MADILIVVLPTTALFGIGYLIQCWREGTNPFDI
jgi:hypothetical protein